VATWRNFWTSASRFIPFLFPEILTNELHTCCEYCASVFHLFVSIFYLQNFPVDFSDIRQKH
jgi:hypothetical protein